MFTERKLPFYCKYDGFIHTGWHELLICKSARPHKLEFVSSGSICWTHWKLKCFVFGQLIYFLLPLFCGSPRICFMYKYIKFRILRLCFDRNLMLAWFRFCWLHMLPLFSVVLKLVSTSAKVQCEIKLVISDQESCRDNVNVYIIMPLKIH